MEKKIRTFSGNLTNKTQNLLKILFSTVAEVTIQGVSCFGKVAQNNIL